MANNLERKHKTKLSANENKIDKSKTSSGTLKALFKKIIPFIIPFLAEGLSGGMLPGNTGFVFWSYLEEKKAGKTPNLGEYVTVGTLAIAADGAGVITALSIFLIPLSYAISIPCLAILFTWRIFKHGFKGPKPIKK